MRKIIIHAGWTFIFLLPYIFAICWLDPYAYLLIVVSAIWLGISIGNLIYVIREHKQNKQNEKNYR